jgi:hypothetical protein
MMRRLRVSAIAALSLFVSAATTDVRAASAETPFGTCAYWRQESTRPSGDLYRIGFAHGLALGVPSNVLWLGGGQPIPQIRILVDRFYSPGLYQVLRRPAVLMEAFDTKCSDYRNTSLNLPDLALVVILDIGGIDSGRSEKALQLLRSGTERVDVLLELAK